MSHVATRGIAVEDLQEEQLHGHDGTQQPVSPCEPCLPAGVFDGLWFELTGSILLELPHDLCDTRYHSIASCLT
jgi:hypothetical protein